MLFTPATQALLEKHDVPIELYHQDVPALRSPTGVFHQGNSRCVNSVPGSIAEFTKVTWSYAQLTEESYCPCLLNRPVNSGDRALWPFLGAMVKICTHLEATPTLHYQALVDLLEELRTQEARLPSFIQPSERALHPTLVPFQATAQALLGQAGISCLTMFTHPQVRASFPVSNPGRTGEFLCLLLGKVQTPLGDDPLLEALVHSYRLPARSRHVTAMILPQHHWDTVAQWVKYHGSHHEPDLREVTPDQVPTIEVALSLWDPGSTQGLHDLDDAFRAAEHLCS